MKSNRPTYTAFVPHGINSKYFRPIEIHDQDYNDYIDFKTRFLKSTPSDFIVFWNNRNVRRKQPGDVVLAFRTFNTLVKSKYPDAKVTLLMHTQVQDENGTDLLAVKSALAPECSIIFSDGKVSTRDLNFYYNLADVTVNIASNEGFGLSGAESLMAGTPIVNNITGGLQDQCRFEDGSGNWINFDKEFTSNHTGMYRKCAPWAKPVFPAVRSLQGSIPTPYIFDDRCRYEDVGAQLFEWFITPIEERRKIGKQAREWMLSEESGMSAEVMSNKFIQHIDFLLETWSPVDRFTFAKMDIKPSNVLPATGIANDYLNITTVI